MKLAYVLILSAFFSTACAGKEFNKMNYSNHSNPYNLEFSEENYATIKGTSKKIRFNPNPQKVYEVTLKIQGSPMPLYPSETVTVGYSGDCNYEVGLIPLYSLTPDTAYKVPIQRIDENTYKLIYIQDAILDEDYGLKYEGKRVGVCHWKARGTSVELTPTGKPQKYSITVGAVNAPDTLAQQLNNPVEVQYFQKKHVTTEPVERFSNGKPMPALTHSGKTRAELAHIEDKDLFTVTVSIKEIQK